jgi:hypothetical protein
MEIILVEKPTPMFRSFTLFADPKMSVLQETKTIVVSFHKKTKTRISTSLQIGDACNTINLQVDGFKLHESSEYSYLSSSRETPYYFVISKAQDFEAYKRYVKALIEKIVTEIFKVELDTLTIELEGKF